MRSALLFSAAAAALMMITAGAASAQEATPQSTPPELEATGVADTGGPELSFNLALTSDYVFRGISQNDEDLAIQGGVDVTSGMLYAGAWASNVDFGDGTNAEVDLYAGVRPEVGGFSLDFGVIYYGYLGQPDDANWDFVEVKAAASRGIGPVTFGAAAFYSPEFTGEVGPSLYSEINAAGELSPRVTLSGAFGKQAVDEGDDYNTWNFGGVFTLTDALSVDLRFWNTDIEDLPIAEERIVATLKAVF